MARSHDEIAYDAYVGFCNRVSVTPLDFESWYKKSEGLKPADVKAQQKFHRNSGVSWPTEDSNPLGHHWDGMWDNVVRALEDKG